MTRIALQDLSPFPLAALRYSIAAALAGLWLMVRRPAWPARQDMPLFLACSGIGIALYNILFNSGEVTITSGVTSFLIAAIPILAAILSAFFLGERLAWQGWLGSCLSFAGVALISLGEKEGLHFGSGVVFILGAAFCGAVYLILQRGLIVKYGPLTVIAYVLLFGGLMLSPWLVRGIQMWDTASWTARMAVVELGVFPAAIGYASWAYVIGRLGASRGTLFMYLLPPFTMALAFCLSGEVPERKTLGGGGVVLAGLVMATWPYRRPERMPTTGSETAER